METYGKILLIATPAFLLLVLAEKWYGWYKGRNTVRTLDMVSSLSSGITNALKDVLGLSIAVISYEWMVDKLALVHVPSGFLTYFVAFMALDLAGYWTHRIAHEYNLFWNNHIIHHSSEDFNLACALRQSISSIVKIFAIFLLPAALLGVPPQVVAVVAPLHLFAQFWYHTEHIHKMGFLEKIIVTPSHHRVHHAINPEYLDKNYGQIFIFWDKLFGTYQEELPHVPAVYGITRPVRTWNPIKINFVHLWLLICDAWRTRNWKDKFRIWLMPTGWRPADVAEKYPVKKIDNIYHFPKYETGLGPAIRIWSVCQLLITLLLVSYLFANVARIGSPGIFIYGAFIYLQIYAFTELMDLSPNAWLWELLKTMAGVWIIYQQNGHWFGANNFLGAYDWMYVGGYLMFSLFVTLYFTRVLNPRYRAMLQVMPNA